MLKIITFWFSGNFRIISQKKCNNNFYKVSKSCKTNCQFKPFSLNLFFTLTPTHNPLRIFYCYHFLFIYTITCFKICDRDSISYKINPHFKHFNPNLSPTLTSHPQSLVYILFSSVFIHLYFNMFPYLRQLMQKMAFETIANNSSSPALGHFQVPFAYSL